MTTLPLLGFRPADDFGFHFIGIAHQSLFITLKLLAQPFSCLRIDIIAGQA